MFNHLSEMKANKCFRACIVETKQKKHKNESENSIKILHFSNQQ